VLYQVNPDAGFVLGLDVGSRFVRGAISDFSGAVRVRSALRVKAGSGRGRIAELVMLAEKLCAEAGLAAADIQQSVLGSPGVYDPGRDAFTLAATLPGWDDPAVPNDLRRAFGPSLVLENDVDAAALAERTHGHGRDVDSFAFVTVGTGIGMGLVLGGRLHRGAHGAAGEIGYLPWDGERADPGGTRNRGSLEAAAAADGIVAAARSNGMRGAVTARSVFIAAQRGDERAKEAVAGAALLVAKAICAVITVADPGLIVLGGGVGQATGFLDAVSAHVRRLAPVQPELRVSALGEHAVVDGCLAAGHDRLWESATAALAPPLPQTAPGRAEAPDPR
jgi:predicted NBD/HSP70 family sugar kinase